MKKFLSNYKSTIILLIAIIIGTIVGLVFKEKASILNPFGDLFLNLLLVIIIPLVFVTISSSIAKMKTPKRLGKIMISIIIIFAITSIIAVLVGLASTFFIKLVAPENANSIKEVLSKNKQSETSEITILERTVNLISVNDFSKLFSIDNLLALLVISVIFGIAINMSKEKAKPVIDLLNSLNVIIENIMKIIMYYAPIGLGCYFASLIGTFGASIAVGYFKTFIVYTIVALAFYFIIYTLYAFISGGKKGIIVFWKNVIPSTITSISTCSSAASIPVNIESCKKMGVPNDIAETTVPLGTSFHKDGSVIGSVFKIMFLVSLFGTVISNTGDVLGIIGVALIANLLVIAVPIGGGSISEMLILTMMGFPVAALPILTIVATIIDAPATLLNVVGDMSSSMLVTRVVDGKNWLNKKSDI